MKTLLWSASVVLLLAIFSRAFALPDEAEKSKAREMIAQGALVVDVRTPEEYASGGHPAATNVPLQVFRERVGGFGDTNRPVVVYCRSGRRSTEARQILLDAGFRNVANGGGLQDVMRVE